MTLFAAHMRHKSDVPPETPRNHERYADFVLRNAALPGNTYGLDRFNEFFPAQGRAAAPDGLPNSGSNNHSAGCGNGPAKESEA